MKTGKKCKKEKTVEVAESCLRQKVNMVKHPAGRLPPRPVPCADSLWCLPKPRKHPYLGEERDTFLPSLLRKRFFRTSLQQLLKCPGCGRYRWRHDQVIKAVTHVLHPSILQTKRESRWPPTPARTENTSYNSKTKTDYKMKKKVLKYQFRRVTLTCITLPSLWQRENWESPTASDSAAAQLIWNDTL